MTYLDTHVPTVDSLASLDSLTNSLRSRITSLNDQLLEIRSSRSESQFGAINAFPALFTQWLENPSCLEPANLPQLTSQFSTALSNLKAQFPNIDTDLPRLASLLHHQFFLIQSLISSSTSLQLAASLKRSATELVRYKLESQFDSALKILLEIQSSLDPQLRDLALPKNNPTSAKIAKKSLAFIDSDIRTPLQLHLSKKLTDITSAHNWPSATIPPSAYSQFIPIFTAFLNTDPANPESLQKLLGAKPKPLSAFTALASPIALRLKFHFSAQSPTNRPDKPEWIYTHFLAVLNAHIDFLLDCCSSPLKDSISFSQRNAVHEFISALLPTLRQILLALFDRVKASPQLLSHLIYESVLFDIALDEKYFYRPFNAPKWPGITGELLSANNDQNFKTWLHLESTSAMTRYEEFIQSKNAWEIDYDFVAIDETKPTQSAINLRDLVESLTTHYSSLASTKFRLRYFVAVQLALLDLFFERLKDSLTAFDAMSSRFSRAVGSVSAEDALLVKGSNGVLRLARIIGSLDYIIIALQQWSEQEFFLQLWDDISANTSLSKDFSDSSFNNTTLFDETIQSYSTLKLNAEKTLLNLLKNELSQAIKPYFKKNDWLQDQSLKTSPELMQALRTVSPLLDFLYRFYSPFAYNALIRQFASIVQSLLWQNIFTANTFSSAGAAQLKLDVEAILTSLRVGAQGSQMASIRKLEEAASLLAWPADGVPTFAQVSALLQQSDFAKVRKELDIVQLSDSEMESLVNRRVSV